MPSTSYQIFQIYEVTVWLVFVNNWFIFLCAISFSRYFWFKNYVNLIKIKLNSNELWIFNSFSTLHYLLISCYCSFWMMRQKEEVFPQHCLKSILLLNGQFKILHLNFHHHHQFHILVQVLIIYCRSVFGLNVKHKNS